MNKELIKKITPYITAVIVFIALSIAYFPSQLEGKKLRQHDMSTYKGGAQEANEFKKETGETTLWTNSMFSGMPTYLINIPKSDNKFDFINKYIRLGMSFPLAHIFLYLLGFYITLLAFKVKPWLSLVGSIGYAFSSYLFIIIAAGHYTKAIALGYMPPVIGGVYLAYNGNKLKGTILMSVFLALQILTNHLQITYYTLLTILVFGGFWLYNSFKQKTLPDFVKTTVLLVVGAVLAVGINATVLYMSYDYGKDSLRGKSELSHNQDVKTSGLDKDYATQWSYGRMETFTFLIPNFKGGASNGSLSENSEVFKLYKNAQGTATAKKAIKNQPLYWGDQPVTSGPVYIGAIICFLFIFGLIIIKGPLKWWLLSATILSVLLGWGHNFMFLTDLFLDYFPGYNKFRTVSMTLVIAGLTMPLLGIIALNKILNGNVPKEEFKKGLYWSLGIAGGFSLIFGMFSGAFNYSGAVDQHYLSQGADVIVDALRADRQALLQKDAFRSLFFVLAIATLVWAKYNDKIKAKYVLPILAILLLADMWPVNKRYLSSENFDTPKQAKNEFAKTKADEIILMDKGLNHRVLNLTVSTFNDASTSYHHKSIGGYHGAKMRRYQDLIDLHISAEIQLLIGALRSNDVAKIENVLSDLTVLNMLNTKYFIINPDGAPLVNSKANGNAWFVHNIHIVDNPDQEIAALTGLNAKETAIIEKRYAHYVSGKTFANDSTATIKLVDYKPNYLKYESKTTSEQLATFSEVFYAKGWQAYIDGKEVDHIRTNYLLRTLIIPEGTHEVEFKFQPKAYHTANIISNVSSIIVFLLLIALVALPYIRKKQQKA